MISVRGLRKHYTVYKRPPGMRAAFSALFRRVPTTVKAVDGISFEIAPGERVGFLGPNGAGKTTTLKVLSGLLYPSEGEVHVDGHVPQRREDAFLKKIMLVMGQKQQLLWDLPPSETFALNRAIYEVPEPVNKPTRSLSLGERMKCELAAALVHGPKVLFLDEPTIGLDVSMQATMRTFIRRYNEENGATLLLTSHYMDDVAALCPRVIVIDKGTLSYDGQLDALVRRMRPEKRVVLRLDKPAPPLSLEGLGKVVSQDAAQVVLQVRQDAVSLTVARALATLSVRDLTVEDPPLEEVMSELFNQNRARAESAA